MILSYTQLARRRTFIPLNRSIFNGEWEVRYVVRITFISELIVASINGGLCWDFADIDVGVITAMEYCNARSNANWIT